MAILTQQPDGTAGIDASIQSGSYAALNFGSVSQIPLGSILSVRCRGLFRFDLSPMPSGASVSAASLAIYADSANSANSVVGTSTFHCARCTRPTWSENGATWNRYDGVSNWTTAGGDYSAVGAVTAEVTSASQAIVFLGLAECIAADLAAGRTVADFLAWGPEDIATNYFSGASSDNADPLLRPTLTVTWSKTYTLTQSQLFVAGLQPGGGQVNAL